MQGNLECGDLVVGVGFVVEKKYNGMDGVVSKDLGTEMCYFSEDTTENLFEAHTYQVRWMNGDLTINLRENLKRKKPPTTDNKSGEEIVFDLFQCRQQFLEECA